MAVDRHAPDPERRPRGEQDASGLVVLSTREAYAGPILPGSRWRSRGASGHSTDETVTVVRLTTTGRVCFVRDRTKRGKTEARHTVDEAVFRRQYALDKQAPEAKQALAYSGALVALREGVLDPDRIEQERRLSIVTNSLANGVATATSEHRPAVAAAPALGTNGSAQMTPPEEPAAAAPSDQAEAAPEPAPVDPLEAFIAHGRATVEQLSRDLKRTEEDREIARLELEELDTRLASMRDRRERVTRAIEAAISAAVDAPPVEAPEEETAALVPVDVPQPDPHSLEARAIIEPAKTKRPAPAHTRWGQQAWFQERIAALAPGEHITAPDLAPVFMARFGFDRLTEANARVNVLFNWRLGQTEMTPRLVRVSRGVYTVEAPPAAETEEAPAPSPGREPVTPETVAAIEDAAEEAKAEAAPEAPATEEEPAPPPTQRDWVMARFAEQRLWAVRDLVPAFMEAFGMDRERAFRNLSSILTERVKHLTHLHPQLIRVSQGLYEAVD
jgi:hypothetical protein